MHLWNLGSKKHTAANQPQSCHELQCGATKKPCLFSNLHYATPLAFLALLSLFLFSFLLLQVFLILVQAKVGLSEVILTFYQHCNSISLCESDWYLGGVGLTDVNIWIRSSEYFIKVSYQKGLYILHSGTEFWLGDKCLFKTLKKTTKNMDQIKSNTARTPRSVDT